MRVMREPGESGRLLTTLAMGTDYWDRWTTFALPSWLRYCENNDLGLVVFDTDLIARDDPAWKIPTWQKLLIGTHLRSAMPQVSDVCFLDPDILINPAAPCVFEDQVVGRIGLVSMRERLPYPLGGVLKRLAFLRNEATGGGYPLDSALFISTERLYAIHDLPPQPDEACLGFLLFNVADHANLLASWFYKYPASTPALCGGEQTHVSFEVQNAGLAQWFDYRFQALWMYEVAWKYPFLHAEFADDEKVIGACIEASLSTNYFVHFAGRWPECQMWTRVRVLDDNVAQRFADFATYERIEPVGEPLRPF